MSLPLLYAAPEDQEGWKSWGFNHAANHYDWIPAFQSQKNIIGFQQFILSPIDPQELGMFLYNHQAAHDQANSALGTQGFNLLSLDWKDPDQFAEWLRANADEHVRISAALGIG
jgi:hypothetical protein